MRSWQFRISGRAVPRIAVGAVCAVVFSISLSVPIVADAADRLGNISTRGKVSPGAGRMRAGFIIQGDTEKCAVVRARGPSINFPGAKVSDPRLTLMDNVTGQVLATNDDWQDQPAATRNKITSAGLEPGNPKEAAVYYCFDPERPYTTIVEGADDGDVGIAIAEVMDADSIAEIQVADGDTAALQSQIDDLTSMVNTLQSQVSDLQAQAHNRYTNAEAVNAVGPHFSGNYNALSNRPALKAVATSGSYYDLVDAPEPGTGSGDSHPAHAYMDVVGGELVISGIDVRLQNGNMLIGTGGVGSGLHNLVIGHNNIWDGDYGVIVGTNNESTKDYTFMYGDWHTVRGSYSGIFGGVGSQILSGNSVIAGGSQNLIQNFGVATLVGGRQRTGGNTTYEVIADG